MTMLAGTRACGKSRRKVFHSCRQLPIHFPSVAAAAEYARFGLTRRRTGSKQQRMGANAEERAPAAMFDSLMCIGNGRPPSGVYLSRARQQGGE
jgi:hypothetical protein